MIAPVANVVVAVLTVYAAVGLVVATVFVWRGVEHIDPAARGAGLGFRLLILPGSIALWPLLTHRWWRRQPMPVERNAHREGAHRRTSSGASR